MRLCNLCREPIVKDEKLAVVALPVPCTHDGGDYSFLDGFSKNETVIHLCCFKKLVPNIESILSGKITTTESISYKNNEDSFTKNADALEKRTAKPTSSMSNLYEALKSLDEEVTPAECARFMSQNRNCTDTSDLIRLWFENRNKVG